MSYEEFPINFWKRARINLWYISISSPSLNYDQYPLETRRPCGKFWCYDDEHIRRNPSLIWATIYFYKAKKLVLRKRSSTFVQHLQVVTSSAGYIISASFDFWSSGFFVPHVFHPKFKPLLVSFFRFNFH